MARRKKKTKRCGTGAICSVLTKYLHPSDLINEKFINRSAGSRVSDLLAIRQEMITVRRKKRLVVVFYHDATEDVEIHAVKRWVRVEEEGNPEHFFISDDEEDAEQDPTHPSNQNSNVDDGVPIENSVFSASNRAEDIAMVRGMGLDVDDDNEPSVENIPPQHATPQQRSTIERNYTHEEVGWGWSGIDHRKSLNIQDQNPAIKGFTGESVTQLSFVGMFFTLFPRTYIENVIIVETNKNLDNKLTLGEFLRWIGICFFLSTLSGFNRRSFWSSKDVSREEGAPYRFNDWMTRSRFEEILSSIQYTDKEPPTYRDRFWEVRQMLKSWNDNMIQNFNPSWVSCLDESMSIWFNKFTCPGWIFCPRKPHPFGNEYHSICCGLSGIMYAVELREGKDAPAQRQVDPEEKKIGKTGCLLLRLTKALYTTGKVVILDSGFCVLQAIIALRENGVFSGALIKKRKYWPKWIDGDAIDRHMEDRAVGECDSFRGRLNGIDYDVFCMKEPEYVMKIMSTYGGLIEKDGQRESRRTYTNLANEKVTTTFKYKEPFANHFYYRHAVDDHNNLRHLTPSIEETWVTHRWPNRVFSFLLAVTEVNIFKAFNYFVWTKDQAPESNLAFRKLLALSFINNDYIRLEGARATRSKDNKRHMEHVIVTAPPHASLYVRGKWQKKAKAKYQQFVCKTPGCKKQVRTYCSCSVGQWMCKDCHYKHLVETLN